MLEVEEVEGGMLCLVLTLGLVDLEVVLATEVESQGYIQGAFQRYLRERSFGDLLVCESGRAKSYLKRGYKDPIS